MQLAAEEVVSIRGTGGVITVDGVSCGAAAQVVEARVLGVADEIEKVTLWMAGFAEVTAIQWSIELGTGPRGDLFTVIGTSAADNVRIGTFADGRHGIELDQNGEIDIWLLDVERATLDGRLGDDRLRGTLAAAAGASPFAGELGLKGGGGDDLLIGGTGRDEINGGAGQDDVRGGEGDDQLSDNDGDDVVDGGPGHDLIYCGPGNDTYLGGTGSELFISGSEPTYDISDGDDLIDGGPGQDRIQYYRSSDLFVDLLQGIGGQAGESDTLVSIWGVIGGTGDDTLIGDNLPNQLQGEDGNDILRGGGGTDDLWCGPGTDSWSEPGDLHHDCEIRL